MIPLYLTISGFLSYREPAELDFSAVELACIAGHNGAGKSSLLDAITWVLFGQARKRDDSLINAQSSLAKVGLVFEYEGNIYSVQRTRQREKTTLLEFHILQGDDTGPPDRRLATGVWKPLTERTLRDTEARIQQMLRMDYETFINASFFLQGKADQFTQQRPGDRKRILGSILGLEAWEGYRQRAAEQRKQVEAELTRKDGQLQEIGAELAEETERRERLKVLEKDLQQASQQRQMQEDALQAIRQAAAARQEQEKLVRVLERQAGASAARLEALRMSLGERRSELQAKLDQLGRAAEIEAAYAEWQRLRQELERWETIAGQFREQEKQREAPRLEIQAGRSRLEQELETLLAQQTSAAAQQAEAAELAAQQAAAHLALQAAEARLAQRQELDAGLQTARQRQAEARAENPRLKAEMDALKTRIDRLSAAGGAECPLCGQPLAPAERQALVEQLNLQGREMGDRYRANQTAIQECDATVRALETQIQDLGQVESELRARAQQEAQLQTRIQALQEAAAAWQQRGALRLVEVESDLANERYAPEARQQLAQIDAGLKAIGYDAEAHDGVRQAELAGRASQAERQALETARAALAPLEREISDLSGQESALQVEYDRQQAEWQSALAAFEQARQSAPDLESAESAMLRLQETENRLRLELGGARQKVLVLEGLKRRRQELEAQREALAVQIGRYKQLERAFGKDGVPALLIEQALPEIESRANDLLARLSDGAMSVRFVTQTAYKDKNRDDLRETLDIQISDSAGIRDYELYSGGEAFRVNFAIRLALSEVLAQRAGARLQTLVIDEGFGSQDTQGRQRLIEAINRVRPDFARILVITHIDELKDAFPTRIEVEKTDFGSAIRVLHL